MSDGDITQKLTDLFGSVSEVEASYKVHAKETHYLDLITVYVPNVPYDKLLPGMELSSKSKSLRTKKGSGESSEEDFERFARRSIKKIRDYALSNRFELFVTFTLKLDRQDINKCKAKMMNWLKNQQKRNGKFGYLVVPEFHPSDGVSIHFHGLIKGYRGKLKEAINPKTGKPLIQNGRQVYNLPGYRSGFTNVKKVDDTPEGRGKTAHYLYKYITKDMPRLFGQNRYLVSDGLAKPRVIENPTDWYLHQPPDRTYTNDYGRFYFFHFPHTSSAAGVQLRNLTEDSPAPLTSRIGAQLRRSRPPT